MTNDSDAIRINWKLIAVALLAGVIGALVLGVGHGGAQVPLPDDPKLDCPDSTPEAYPLEGCESFLEVLSFVVKDFPEQPTLTCIGVGKVAIHRSAATEQSNGLLQFSFNIYWGKLGAVCTPGPKPLVIDPAGDSGGSCKEQSTGDVEFPTGTGIFDCTVNLFIGVQPLAGDPFSFGDTVECKVEPGELFACLPTTLPIPLPGGATVNTVTTTLFSCPVSPDLDFPDGPGCDVFPFVGSMEIKLTNTAVVEAAPLTLTCSAGGGGLIRVVRGDVDDKQPNGFDELPGEIDFINAGALCQPGNVPIMIKESPTVASITQAEEKKNNDPGTLEFPADSFFDVFLEIETPFGTLHNKDPFVVNCQIEGYPPIGCPFIGSSSVTLFNDAQKEVGTINSIEASIPFPVGGLVVDLDEDLGDLPLETAQSSGNNAGVLAGTIAGITALAVALTGAAWYARRRWAR